MSTSGAQRKTRMPGKVTIELTVAICSTETPACASRNGSGVDLKPTMIPSGRISMLKIHGAGQRCGSLMLKSWKYTKLRLATTQFANTRLDSSPANGLTKR